MPIAHGEKRSACPEPEILAAFLDRRLAADERARVADHLAECEACYEVFADSARFKLEEEASARRATVVPFRARRRWAWAAGLAAAAALVAAVLWSPILGRPAGGGAETVAGVPLPHGSAAGRFPDEAWSSLRSGGGRGPGLAPPTLSFRAGVRSVDLTLALAAGDASGAAALLPELRAHAEGFELSQAIVALLDAAGERLEDGRLVEASSLVREAVDSLTEAADRLWYPFGAWAEAGRVAAAAGEVDHFRDRRVRALARRRVVADLPAPLAEPVGRLVSQRLGRGIAP